MSPMRAPPGDQISWFLQNYTSIRLMSLEIAVTFSWQVWAYPHADPAPIAKKGPPFPDSSRGFVIFDNTKSVTPADDRE